MKRYFKALGYLLSVHVLALLVMTLFRLVEFIALHGMIVDAEASRVMAFVKGVWFDNVIACYISVLPVAVLLVAASLGWCHRRLLRGINIWYAAWFAIAFMPSAANTPYFQYFFKNINSSIFGWFGYVATTSGMLLQESSYWLYIALYFVFTGAFIYALVRLRRYFEGLFLLPKDNMHLVLVVSRFLISAVMIGACLFGIRGRMGYNPIKVSQAYYCEDSFLNQLGINPAFNLLTSALDDMRKENKELHLMPYAEAITNTRQWLGITGKVDSTNILKREVVNDSLMMKMGKNSSLAKKNHPNVVVILMESMSSNLLGTFGNQQPLTPTLDSLYNHSLAFTHFYSAGIHTNHGMTATLYSFPALMFRNLMKGTVTPRRKGIATVLKKYGYENMFFMTHEAQYDNMKAFFQTNGYDDIFSQENYPKSEVVNSFGVSDHFEMGYALNTINQKAKTGKPFIHNSFYNHGKTISDDMIERICNAMQCHSWYMQQFCFLIWTRTATEVTEEIYQSQLAKLLDTNADMFITDIDGMPASQIAFLRAVCMGEIHFNAQQVVAEYGLGAPRTITKNKKTLVERDFIEKSGDGFKMVDPVFELWFKRECCNILPQ